ncbi:MAG TPA: hypothetical protein VF669_18015 [Tepidisphaeraceae bacterium]|jgi:hypothetical protein
MNKIPLIIAILIISLTQFSRAQDTPVPAPATTLPTTTRPRHEASIPQGFNRIEVGGRIALAEQADAQIVQQQLAAMKPTSRPSLVGTMLDRAKQNRDQLIGQLAQETGADPAAVTTVYDQRIITPLQKLYDLNPPVLYLVVGRERLKELLKSGWQDPNFYYNRAADAIVMSGNVAVRTDGPMDDAIIGAMYDPAAKDEDKAKRLTDAVAGTEGDLVRFLDGQAKSTFGAGLATIINETAFKDLQFKDDQRWLPLGLPIVLASKYAAGPTDQPDLLKAMTMDNPQNPLRFSSVDLLHPPAVNTMNPEAMPFYIDAARRKSAAAIQKLVDQQGAVPKVLAAIRQQMPADGAALVKVIQDQTGIDLTKDLSR